ncbi:unnamed protein product [Allacma fusca]|uniref:FAD synthase n=1 Tax=Allacma fusca TaxID=39272 RepID=A0A8J2MEA9_9HEXA|nr:unnamed protein product [Allacma fusca]
MEYLSRITRITNLNYYSKRSIGSCQQTFRNSHLGLSYLRDPRLFKEMSACKNLSSASHKPKTAGVIVIGDEILKGQVLDTNSHYLAKKLYSLGVRLKRVSVIGDFREEIAQEVKTFSEQFDFVFTTGGIGPTHDDVTYAGVAMAFNEQVTRNEKMMTMIQKWLGHRGYSEDVIMRMAEMPSSAQLLFDPQEQSPLSSFPIVIVRNVYVFPGIPRFLESMFPRMEPILKELGSTFYSNKVYVNRDELSLTPELDKAVEKFKDSVTFGSYPVIGNPYYSTRFTLESSQPGHVESAVQFLHETLPENSVIDFDDQPLVSAGDKVYAIADDPSHSLHSVVRQAVEIIEESLEQYGIDGVWICFNGGKDCTVLLHLFYAVVAKKYPHAKDKLNGLCITIDDPFLEVESFMNDSAQKYGLNLRIFEGPIKAGLSEALEKYPGIRAVLMGTRRSDPSGKNLNYFQMTDSSWPQAMRVSPILEWSYQELWNFIRSLTLPYCKLYDQGFTSLGSKSNTAPNPKLLRNSDQNGTNSYMPAYKLENGTTERSGRC